MRGMVLRGAACRRCTSQPSGGHERVRGQGGRKRRSCMAPQDREGTSCVQMHAGASACSCLCGTGCPQERHAARALPHRKSRTRRLVRW